MGFYYNPFKAIKRIFTRRRNSYTYGSENFEKKLARSMKRIGKEYRSGKQPSLDTPIDRLAYTIQYSPIGMAATRRLAKSLRKAHLPNRLSLFWHKPLEVISIGAGPGTDLFGFLMGLSSVPKGLSFTRADILKKWGVYYKEFQNDFKKQVGELTDLITEMTDDFHEIDLSRDKIFMGKLRNKMNESDIILLNRVLSTFQQDESKIYDIIKSVSEEAQDDTLLFVLDVSLPRPKFRDAIALTEGICRLTKPNSEWVVKCSEIREKNFGWSIPQSLISLEKYFGYKITRSGRFFGGVVWLRE